MLPKTLATILPRFGPDPALQPTYITGCERWRLGKMKLKILALGVAMMSGTALMATPAFADDHGGHGGGDWHGGGGPGWHGGGGPGWHGGGGDWHHEGFFDGGRHWHWYQGYGPAFGYYGPPPVYYVAPPPPVYYAPPRVYVTPPSVVISPGGIGIAP